MHETQDEIGKTQSEETETSNIIVPQFNYLTGEKLQRGQEVSKSLGGVPYYSSYSGKKLTSFSAEYALSIANTLSGSDSDSESHVGLVKSSGEDRSIMFVLPEEVKEIQEKDEGWKVADISPP